MNKYLGMAAIACGLVITGVASAAGMQDQEGWVQKRAAGMVIRRIEHKLNITDLQREQIKSILQTETPTIEALAARLQQQNAELLAQTDFDEAHVRAFAEQHAATAADMLVERERVRHKLLHVLTLEQQQTIQAMRAESRRHMNERLESFIDEI